MKKLPYITLGRILEDLWSELGRNKSEEEKWKTLSNGRRIKILPITRMVFYRLEKKLDLPKNRITTGSIERRIYSPGEAKRVKELIKEHYRLRR